MKIQIPLPLKHVVSYPVDGFIRVQEQSEALKYYDELPVLPLHGLYIYGPQKSGKTHLAKLFAHKGIQQIFTIEDALKLERNAVALVDNITSETDLFHIVNHIIQISGKIVLFSCFYLEEIKLQDLQSRLKLLKFLEIKSPQEEFMKVLFFKLFSDHQISIQEDVIDFLITRLPRDYQTLHTTVEILNQASISNKRTITIPFVKEILDF